MVTNWKQQMIKKYLSEKWQIFRRVFVIFELKNLPSNIKMFFDVVRFKN